MSDMAAVSAHRLLVPCTGRGYYETPIRIGVWFLGGESGYAGQPEAAVGRRFDLTAHVTIPAVEQLARDKKANLWPGTPCPSQLRIGEFRRPSGRPLVDCCRP